MGVHVIIDGYNMIFAANSSPANLEAAREELAELLALYKKARSHEVTIVFDAQHVDSFESRSQRIKGIPVVYSPPGRTADSVIADMAERLGPKAIVVSSDRELQGRIKRAGAAFVSCSEFSRRLGDALYESIGKGGDPEDGPQDSTRKKGPSRRLPKARRNLLRKREKL
jgi:predicted RNA-binding protein with PIN domain